MSEILQSRIGRSPTVLEQIGDFARPFAIYATSGSAAVAVGIIAMRVPDFSNAAIFIGAVFAGVGGIYTAKAWENVGQAKQDALVKVAQAAGPTPPSVTITPAAAEN